MLLQKLVEYAERIDQPMPYGYALVSVRYEIHLDGEGRLVSPEPIDLKSAENKFGQRRVVPQVKRQGIRPPPLLLADHAEYTLGLPRKPEDGVKAAIRHADYLALLDACAAKSGNPRVQAVLKFLRSAAKDQLRMGDDFDRSGPIEFRVEGSLVTQDADVQRFWSAYNQPEQELMQCIVCNQMKPALETLPGVIKGIPKGNASGTSIISANADAFLSYGLKQSKVSPICSDCADAFTKGINDLIRQPDSAIRIGETLYVFWTRTPVAFSLASFLDKPDPQQVQDLIAAVRSGKYDSEVDGTQFYAAALTANNSRAVVRDWIDTTLGDIKQALERWFSRQRIVGPYGDEPRNHGIFALAAATVRDPKKELASATVTALMESALTGRRLPERLLQQAVRRCQVEDEDKKVTAQRVALLKLVLLSNYPEQYSEDDMIQLQPEHPEPAYHCGRLLAVLAAIQERSADGKLNATLIDRFYGTASSAPASVFGTLIRGAQPHIAKLRKNKPRAALRMEAELEEVLSALPQFPLTLTAKEQAVFALGYYHQRAADRARAQEAKQAKRAADQASDDSMEADE